MPLTLEEQERRAYISGDVEKARLLAHAIDGDAELAEELQQSQEHANAEEKRADDLSGKVDDLEVQIDDLKQEVSEHREHIAELATDLRTATTERDEARELLRATLVGDHA